MAAQEPGVHLQRREEISRRRCALHIRPNHVRVRHTVSPHSLERMRAATVRAPGLHTSRHTHPLGRGAVEDAPVDAQRQEVGGHAGVGRPDGAKAPEGQVEGDDGGEQPQPQQRHLRHVRFCIVSVECGCQVQAKTECVQLQKLGMFEGAASFLALSIVCATNSRKAEPSGQ